MVVVNASAFVVDGQFKQLERVPCVCFVGAVNKNESCICLAHLVLLAMAGGRARRHLGFLQLHLLVLVAHPVPAALGGLPRGVGVRIDRPIYGERCCV